MQTTKVGVIVLRQHQRRIPRQWATGYEDRRGRCLRRPRPWRARAKATDFSIPPRLHSGRLLGSPRSRSWVNLTIPQAHAQFASLPRGRKSTYCEKPSPSTALRASRVLDFPREGPPRRLRPGTFMGGGGRLAASLIDDGVIGEPVALSAFMLGHGTRAGTRRPSSTTRSEAADFDMGPYYIHRHDELPRPGPPPDRLRHHDLPER